MLVRDFARTEQRITIDHDPVPFSVPSDEWRLLNETNLTWLSNVLSNATQKPIEDEAWFVRAIRFQEYLTDRLAVRFQDTEEFIENSPF